MVPSQHQADRRELEQCGEPVLPDLRRRREEGAAQGHRLKRKHRGSAQNMRMLDAKRRQHAHER